MRPLSFSAMCIPTALSPPPPPPLASLAAPLPLPEGGFNYIYYTKRTGNTQPRPHPPPARAVRPRPSRLGARVGPSDSSLPPAPPRGAYNYISLYYCTYLLCIRAHPRTTFFPLLGLSSARKPRFALACRQAYALAKVLRLRIP